MDDIGQNIGPSASTVKSFCKSYLQNGTINTTRGKPVEIISNHKNVIDGLMNTDPLHILQSVANEFDLPKSSVKDISNENGIKILKGYLFYH